MPILDQRHSVCMMPTGCNMYNTCNAQLQVRGDDVEEKVVLNRNSFFALDLSAYHTLS